MCVCACVCDNAGCVCHVINRYPQAEGADGAAATSDMELLDSSGATDVAVVAEEDAFLESVVAKYGTVSVCENDDATLAGVNTTIVDFLIAHIEFLFAHRNAHVTDRGSEGGDSDFTIRLCATLNALTLAVLHHRAMRRRVRDVMVPREWDVRNKPEVGSSLRAQVSGQHTRPRHTCSRTGVCERCM